MAAFAATNALTNIIFLMFHIRTINGCKITKHFFADTLHNKLYTKNLKNGFSRLNIPYSLIKSNP